MQEIEKGQGEKLEEREGRWKERKKEEGEEEKQKEEKKEKETGGSAVSGGVGARAAVPYKGESWIWKYCHCTQTANETDFAKIMFYRNQQKNKYWKCSQYIAK